MGSVPDCYPLRQEVGQGPSPRLEQRATSALLKLDLLYLAIREEVGPATGPARLAEARWEAARALLMELIREHDARLLHGAAEPLPLSPGAQGALVRAITKGAEWTRVGQTLVQLGGRTDG